MKAHTLYLVSHIPVLKEATVIDWKNMCLVTELRLPNDKHECLLDEIPIAVDINGRCHSNMDDEYHENIMLLTRC